MKKIIYLIFLFSLYSCATPYLEKNLVWNELPSKKIYLVSSDAEGSDTRVHKAFIKELRQRGFDVIDMKDHMPPASGEGIILKYKETWGWDIVMVISTIDVTLLDVKNKKIIGTAYWGRPFLHNYPSPETAVAQIMMDMNLKYVNDQKSEKLNQDTKKKCTTDQILKMKEIGMTNSQIKSACE